MQKIYLFISNETSLVLFILILSLLSMLFYFIYKYNRSLKTLKTMERGLNLATETAEMSFWSYNVKNKSFSLFSNQFKSKSEISLDRLKNFIHPNDYSLLESTLNKLLKGETNDNETILRFYLNKDYHAIQINYEVVKNKQGIVLEVTGSQIDVTDKLKQNKKFFENKQMLEFTMEAAAIYPWEYHTETQLFNTALTFSGLFSSKSHVTGFEPLKEYIHPEYYDLFCSELKKLINQEIPLMKISIKILSRDRKEYRWIESHALPYRFSDQGTPLKIIGLSIDITDLKNTAKQIHLREQAEESNRMKTAFLANMSHEIRTPLNAIVGFSSLLSETDSSEEKQEFNQIIKENNNLLLSLINDILDLSRIEAGRIEFNYSRFDLSEVSRNLTHVFTYRAKKDVKLICEIPEDNFFIVSEKTRITQIYSNFLSNACKYTTHGFISFGYKIKEDSLYLYVSDTGKGIAPENIDHVFERFSKFDAFVQGTGLGLSICEVIAKKLGGNIGVSSEINKGSTFWVTLPLSSLKINLKLFVIIDIPFMEISTTIL